MWARQERGFRSDMTVQDDVRGFIVETFFVADPDEVTDDLSLIDSAIVDSTGMLDVILFLEERYAIRVEDHETTPANLETIGRIASYVDRKRSEAAATS
jgi:acyl carrier protein